jgi:hypothetical protein
MARDGRPCHQLPHPEIADTANDTRIARGGFPAAAVWRCGAPEAGVHQEAHEREKGISSTGQ